jgi:hypothetical protein
MCKLRYPHTVHSLHDADSYPYPLRRSWVSSNSYPLHRCGLPDADTDSYSLRRSSVSDPNSYSLHRCGLRDADTYRNPAG